MTKNEENILKYNKIKNSLMMYNESVLRGSHRKITFDFYGNISIGLSMPEDGSKLTFEKRDDIALTFTDFIDEPAVFLCEVSRLVGQNNVKCFLTEEGNNELLEYKNNQRQKQKVIKK